MKISKSRQRAFTNLYRTFTTYCSKIFPVKLGIDTYCASFFYRNWFIYITMHFNFERVQIWMQFLLLIFFCTFIRIVYVLWSTAHFYNFCVKFDLLLELYVTAMIYSCCTVVKTTHITIIQSLTWCGWCLAIKRKTIICYLPVLGATWLFCILAKSPLGKVAGT